MWIVEKDSEMSEQIKLFGHYMFQLAEAHLNPFLWLL